MNDAPPPQLLEMIGNLSEFHREHEKFYAQAPLGQAVKVQAASRVLKALADHWSSASPIDRPVAGDMEATGEWLSAAMEKAWGVAGALAAYPELADLLGERHRIIANDGQSANEQALIARLLRRALEIVDRVDFSPGALRGDPAGERSAAAYLYSASELLDRAADLAVQSASLVHDNERRWRTFSERIRQLKASD